MELSSLIRGAFGNNLFVFPAGTEIFKDFRNQKKRHLVVATTKRLLLFDTTYLTAPTYSVLTTGSV